MRRIITERNLVIVLFVMVIVTFSFAERDTKKIEHLYIEGDTPALPTFNTLAEVKAKTVTENPSLLTPVKVIQ